VQKRFADMRETFDDALVTAREELEAGIRLPDNDDRHVVTAAIRADAQAIVTFNVDDFPGETLNSRGGAEPACHACPPALSCHGCA
jgi:hypothetical protein